MFLQVRGALKDGRVFGMRHMAVQRQKPIGGSDHDRSMVDNNCPDWTVSSFPRIFRLFKCDLHKPDMVALMKLGKIFARVR
jgi:hypothetical protein